MYQSVTTIPKCKRIWERATRINCYVTGHIAHFLLSWLGFTFIVTTIEKRYRRVNREFLWQKLERIKRNELKYKVVTCNFIMQSDRKICDEKSGLSIYHFVWWQQPRKNWCRWSTLFKRRYAINTFTNFGSSIYRRTVLHVKTARNFSSYIANLIYKIIHERYIIINLKFL